MCHCCEGVVLFLNVFLHYATLSAKKAALEKVAAEAKAAEEAAGMLPHLTICICLCHCCEGVVHLLNVVLHYVTLSAKKAALEKAAAEAKAAEEAAGMLPHMSLFVSLL